MSNETTHKIYRVRPELVSLAVNGETASDWWIDIRNSVCLISSVVKLGIKTIGLPSYLI